MWEEDLRRGCENRWCAGITGGNAVVLGSRIELELVLQVQKSGLGTHSPTCFSEVCTNCGQFYIRLGFEQTEHDGCEVVN